MIYVATRGSCKEVKKKNLAVRNRIPKSRFLPLTRTAFILQMPPPCDPNTRQTNSVTPSPNYQTIPLKPPTFPAFPRTPPSFHPPKPFKPAPVAPPTKKTPLSLSLSLEFV